MSVETVRRGELPEVTCAGTPRQRGEQHGEALRGQIGDGLGRWAEAIAATHGIAPDAYIADFVQGTYYLPAILCSPRGARIWARSGGAAHVDSP